MTVTSLPLLFLAGGPGGLEILILFLLILVLFGPRRLPQIARMIGRALDELRRASQDFKDQIMTLDQDEDPEHKASSPRGQAGTAARSSGGDPSAEDDDSILEAEALPPESKNDGEDNAGGGDDERR